MNKNSNLTLADSICDLRSRKIKTTFFKQINSLLDWSLIDEVIKQYYKKGNSAAGKPAYEGLLLFKACLLQTWYGLSDYEVEDRINDSISFSYFCGMSINEVSPDHSTISRFRTLMTKKGAYDDLFKQINDQLEAHCIIVKTGALVDASIIDSPLKPKGRPQYKVAEDREATERSSEELGKEKESKRLDKRIASSVDTEGAWVKKAGKLRYGYKKHHLTDEQGLILGVVTTAANLNEISNLEEVLDSAQLPEGIPIKADKGYQSKKNADLLVRRKLKNQILKKAKKNHPLTKWEKRFNKIIGQTRYKVERTFGSIIRWFRAGVARYRGIKKMHTQNLMEAISYNLYRSPGIIMSNSIKNLK
jgi:IS5 family transposase